MDHILASSNVKGPQSVLEVISEKYCFSLPPPMKIVCLLYTKMNDLDDIFQHSCVFPEPTADHTLVAKGQKLRSLKGQIACHLAITEKKTKIERANWCYFVADSTDYR